MSPDPIVERNGNETGYGLIGAVFRWKRAPEGGGWVAQGLPCHPLATAPCS